MKHKAKKIIALTAISAATIHIINRVEYSHATMKSLLPSTQNRYYEWRFGKIKYTKKGLGTPLLLLHDLTPGSSSYEFHKIIDSLSKKYEVYCVDFLGYGLSDKPNITFTNYLYVQMVTDFIKNIIGRKTNIIATGEAFPIAVMTCHNDNDIVNKLLAINPPSLYQLNQIPSKQTKLLKVLLDIPILGTFIYNLHTNKAAMTKVFQEEYFYNAHEVKEKDIDCYVEAAHTKDYNSKYSYASYIGKYMNANIVHALKEIDNCIYIIAGDGKEDSENIIENYIYYNNAVEAAFISKTKQLPHMEKPDETMKNIELFLS